MARLPRLAMAGQPHHLIQRGHNRQDVFADALDRQAYLDALREAAAQQRVAVHGYVLMDDHVHLLVTPPAADSLSRMMQALGRRYVAAFNRRHGRSGTLWEGRFRATVLDGEQWLLKVLRCIEQNPVRTGRVAQAADWPWSSAAHHLGRRRDLLVTEPLAYWVLGNTPFERELAWQRQLEEPLSDGEVRAIVDSALKGWVLGAGSFLAKLQAMPSDAAVRPLTPRRRGRPPKRAAVEPD